MKKYAIERFSISVEYRAVEGDQGLAIHIYGPTEDSENQEILRFDCFENEPHYHLGWSYRQTPFIRINSNDPFLWALQQISTNINELLEASNALTMTDLERSVLLDVVPDLKIDGANLLSAR